jgi:hypothetical protein
MKKLDTTAFGGDNGEWEKGNNDGRVNNIKIYCVYV